MRSFRDMMLHAICFFCIAVAEYVFMFRNMRHLLLLIHWILIDGIRLEFLWLGWHSVSELVTRKRVNIVRHSYCQCFFRKGLLLDFVSEALVALKLCLRLCPILAPLAMSWRHLGALEEDLSTATIWIHGDLDMIFKLPLTH